MTPHQLAEEISDFIRNNNIRHSTFASGEFSESQYQELLETYGDITCVAEERNPYKNSRELQDQFYVIHFIKLDMYLQIESEYSSWDSDRDGEIFAVEPYEVKVKNYRRIK